MMPNTTITLEGFIPAEKTGSYLHLPFEVPPGTGRIDIHYSYDSAIGAEPQYSGGNTIDIGLFDERGPVEGFRGWSGSDRADFFLASDSAAPGYMPGPILPGTWYILFGLYKLAPQGCQYKVSIGVTPGKFDMPFPPLLSPTRTSAHLPKGLNHWYRGELHCHSVHSDGDSLPRTIIERAQSLGLDFLALTDHNILSHWADLASQHPDNLTLIPGYEVTTYRGHWNIWGGQGFIDFQIETAEQMER